MCVFYNWKNFVYDLLYDTKLEVDLLHDILSFFSEFRHKKLHFDSQLIVQIVFARFAANDGVQLQLTVQSSK